MTSIKLLRVIYFLQINETRMKILMSPQKLASVSLKTVFETVKEVQLMMTILTMKMTRQLDIFLQHTLGKGCCYCSVGKDVLIVCVVVDEGPEECFVVDAVVVVADDDSDANCGSFVDAVDNVAEANVAVFVADRN